MSKYRFKTGFGFIWLTLLFISFMQCSSPRESNESIESIDFFSGQQASWIEDSKPLPTEDSLFYLENPAPYFRKEFTASKEIKNAKLMITSAGYYKAFINGKKVGKNILDPGWTDYSKRIYFAEYDVSDLLQEDDNCLGVSLGNGFYNPLPLRKWGRRNLRKDLTVGKPTFIAKLIIQYEDGEIVEIVSDKNWKTGYGPILKNSVYIGVHYDSRKEIQGWNEFGFDDQSWKNVELSIPPGGELQEAFFPPVQITEVIKPIEITEPSEATYVVDMGTIFTGTYKIKLSGQPGDQIVFRFGERIYEDGNLNPMTTVIGQIKRKGVGGPGAPAIAWQQDSYIIGDEGESWFQPDFTYHVYRYIEIKGLSKAPEMEDIEGLAFHTNVEDNGEFTSSSPLLNSIQSAIERTFLSNLISVQSDCAAREKFGYGGDLNATSESYIYNFNMNDIYRKTVYDWVDAMNDSIFVDTAPFVGVKYCGISWESAYLTTQYNLYLYYSNTELVKELYDLNLKWMEKAARIHPDGLVEDGLSDHESLLPVPVELTGTGHYLQCARIMSTFASVMGDESNKKKFDNLAKHLKGIIQEKFWDQPVKGEINRQTLFSTLLYHDIIPENEIKAGVDSLMKAVKSGPAGHFNTGIFGTKYVLEVLSENGYQQEVFDIINSVEFPGWGFMIDNGATTIWETWRESDNTFSNNHPMFGVPTEWYYRWLGGIRPDPSYPGFEKFILTPFTPDGLDHLKTEYVSPFGKIVSNWEKDITVGDVQFNIIIPEGTEATVKLPIKGTLKISISKNGADFKDSQNYMDSFNLTAGNYTIQVSD